MDPKAKKRARAGIVGLRDGTRTEVIIMRCSPKFRRDVERWARIWGVPVSRALEELATSQLTRITRKK